MKRILSFLLIALCSVTVMYSQVTITKASHGFTNNDKHETIAVDYQAPGEAGQGLVWDFSNVESDGKAAISQESYMEESRGVSNIAANRSDNVTFFFDITDKGNEYIGYESETQKLILNEPLVKTLYPQGFGKYFEGNFSGEMINKSTENATPVSGVYSTHADATGTLILPDGNTFEALRIHTTERMDFPNYAYTTEKYLWYAGNVKYPLFVTMETYTETSDGKMYNGLKKSYLSVGYSQAPQNPTNMAKIADISYKVSPNPFTNAIELSYYLPEAANVTVELFTSVGTKVATLLSNEVQSGYVSFSENVGDITNQGEVYILKLTLGEQTQTIKLVKSNK